MAQDKVKGLRFKVFSGKAEPLNRLILMILRASRGSFTKYEIALKVRHVIEFKHTDKNTVYRRIEALHEQDYVSIVGGKKVQPGWPSELFAINDRGLAVLNADEKIQEFILTANHEKLRKFNELFP